MLMSKTWPVAAALVLGLCAAPFAIAGPRPTRCCGGQIDDIVSLDPAKSFEFSGNDMLNNIYNSRSSSTRPTSARWCPASPRAGSRRRRHDLHLQDAAGRRNSIPATP